MLDVHWWAAFGLICLIGGLAALWRAFEMQIAAAADRAVLSRQLAMLREARVLSEYGAHSEAAELLNDAIKLGEH